MGNIVNPSHVTLIEKDGECKLTITLEININVNNPTPTLSVVTSEKKELEEPKEKTTWAMPEFGKAEKIRFGNKKEE